MIVYKIRGFNYNRFLKMKGLKLFALSIGFMTSLCTCNNAFCDYNKHIQIIDNNTENEHQINIPNIQNIFQAVNSFNVLHQTVNQFEQENDVANLEYNYKFEQYENFRRQLYQIISLVNDYIFDANMYGAFNQQNVNIPQQIQIFSDYLLEYDRFLIARQRGSNMNEHIPNLH